MQLSRRRFLGYAAATLPLPLGSLRLRRESAPGWSLLELDDRCRLPESIAGYQAALASLGTRVSRVGPESASLGRGLIVPAAVELPRPAVSAIVSCLQQGGWVILESGAAFACDRELRSHRVLAWDAFQVRLDSPIDLWSLEHQGAGIPYIEYVWPHATKVRDFSRVVPVGGKPSEVIAWVRGIPVALKRPFGRGMLLVLGSPLGPALWSGDAEARGWLRSAVQRPTDYPQGPPGVGRAGGVGPASVR